MDIKLNAILVPFHETHHTGLTAVDVHMLADSTYEYGSFVPVSVNTKEAALYAFIPELILQGTAEDVLTFDEIKERMSYIIPVCEIGETYFIGGYDREVTMCIILTSDAKKEA